MEDSFRTALRPLGFYLPRFAARRRRVLHHVRPRIPGGGKPVPVPRTGGSHRQDCRKACGPGRDPGEDPADAGVKDDAFITVLPPNRTQRAEIAALVATDLPARDLRAAIRSLEGSRPSAPDQDRRAITPPAERKIDRERSSGSSTPPQPQKGRESTVNLSLPPLPDP